MMYEYECMQRIVECIMIYGLYIYLFAYVFIFYWIDLVHLMYFDRVIWLFWQTTKTRAWKKSAISQRFNSSWELTTSNKSQISETFLCCDFDSIYTIFRHFLAFVWKIDLGESSKLISRDLCATANDISTIKLILANLRFLQFTVFSKFLANLPFFRRSDYK